MFPENWHFNSHFVLETTKTPVFVFILRFFDELIIEDPFFDVVKRLHLSIHLISEFSKFHFKIST